MEHGAPCRYLDWDSEFFGVRIARIDAPRLTPETLRAAMEWCGAHAIECAYFLAGLSDPATLTLVERAGFSLVDVRVTLERALGGRAGRTPGPTGPAEAGSGESALQVRPAEPRDVPALAAMASVNHRDTRFHFDPRFPRERSDRLYATWIERSCAGWADAVLVSALGDVPVGYVTGHLDGATGRIGLMGVDASARGRGVGRALVGAALRWFEGSGAATVAVATQGRNVSAVRLYEAAGFATASVELWYHRWFDAARARESGRE